MRLLEALRSECVEVGARADHKDQALRQIAQIARRCQALADVDEALIYEGLREREGLGSTGFGHAIAIPHCRLAGVDRFVVGALTYPEGLAFESLDEQPVNLVTFIIAPARQSDEHIRMLSAISQALHIPGAIDEMIQAPTSAALFESFGRYARDDVDESERGRKNLIHLFVQDEGLFRELLGILTGLNAEALTIVEGEHADRYRAHQPLFAGFWSDESDRFMRVIVAAVSHRLTNEIIRRVDKAAGGLDKRRDVMVAVQELLYFAGAIDA